MPPTIAELGKLAGCSIATVSRALNNSGSVSPKTRESVMKALRTAQAGQGSIGKNSARRGKATGRQVGFVEIILHRHTIYERVELNKDGLRIGPLAEQPSTGVLDEQSGALSHAFYRRIVDAAVAELGRWDQRAVMQFNSDLMDGSFLQGLNRPDCNGVILVGEPSPDLGPFIAQCSHPLILADSACDSWPSVVTVDNIAGITMAFEHVYKLGHRKIGFVGAELDNFAAAERFTAFKMRLADVGLPLRPDWVYGGGPQIQPAVRGMTKILSLADRPTALVCVNDWNAIATIRAAESLGLSVPRDVSVVGFDDVEIGSLFNPPLTTVRVPVTEIGRQAVRQLMIQIQAGISTGTLGSKIRLVPELIVRSSTATVAG
ncbi:MAG TPA: LacI family DNA-binding transcriptional regulator [Tepidisphaeraceae bacterium]|jgi:DNA-binding LacI/PurR family transcriptional regulator|nr:LacI family DNA-binding transcriptional regulator [Tepidisphaeraceae bacterium]